MSTSAFSLSSDQKGIREEFYSRLDAENTAPLWAVMAKLVTPQPRPACQAAKWDYADMRALLIEAGGLITAKEAERRVLILENPGIRGLSQITQSLYAGLQMIMPGEIAPSHRHAASALRFVMEGEGGYTAVNGERITMHPGDFIITPSWTFHDHGNQGTDPIIWLDGLDVPIVNLFDTSFAESYGGGDVQPVSVIEGDTAARYGANMLPHDHAASGLNSPIFCYPYQKAKGALDQLHISGSVDKRHGIKMRYVNPITGQYPMPTMAAFLQLLPADFKGKAYRSTDSTVYCVKEGVGRSVIEDTVIEWKQNDVFVVPSWAKVSHEVAERSVLFSFSDRAAQQALGLWREEAIE